ncbi:GNAT family N-acetyltransferase [uncultured Clostridium sp.]|uniref:GNAT family N-acetyltransferase n=1 Tax=uncultured Clostridium sp. TaxID=59620 RepID=UPI0028EBF61D|nr:GNAT family N-acetyltransferase [uncultured Clostridium sp.]
MLIEKLKIEDIPKLLNLYKELIPYTNSVQESIEVYKQMLEDKNYVILVAKEGNMIVGSSLGVVVKSLAVSGKPFLVIEAVIIKDEFRRKGIGRKIFDKLDEFAMKNKCAYSILVSSANRKEAHKFYESLGFIDEVRGFRKKYE